LILPGSTPTAFAMSPIRRCSVLPAEPAPKETAPGLAFKSFTTSAIVL
jgi:hypothetical protein